MFKEIFLFNTATRTKVPFKSMIPGEVKMYCCGPTVYHFAHIGNMRMYVFEDLLVRTLNYAGFKVKHAMNVTDVGHLVSDGDEGEDKMEAGSRREGKSAWDIAKYYSDAFFSDFTKLNCRMPQIVCKATDHIQEMIDLVADLEKKGFTYRTQDGIYFDTVKFPTYSKFARLDVTNLEAGIRVAVGDKRKPTDFALWKISTSGEKRQMEWDSPWGKGFPGWHIECSAMAMKHLGETFDIHCGGKDHIPVHHTNEIAQSEAATGKTFAHVWMHGEFLMDDSALDTSSGKMSKSTGEFLKLSVLEDRGFRPAEYRFLLLQAHYRSEIRFSWASITAAKTGLRGLLDRMKVLESELQASDSKILNSNLEASEKFRQYRHRFQSAIFDDLNSTVAVSVLFEMIKDPLMSANERLGLLGEFDEVLGIDFKGELAAIQSDVIPYEVHSLALQRDEARKNRNFQESDRLRALITERGFHVEDSPTGTKVTKK